MARPNLRFSSENRSVRGPMNVHPEVRQRLRQFLMNDASSGRGYSEFIADALDAIDEGHWMLPEKRVFPPGSCVRCGSNNVAKHDEYGWVCLAEGTPAHLVGNAEPAKDLPTEEEVSA